MIKTSKGEKKKEKNKETPRAERRRKTVLNREYRIKLPSRIRGVC